MKLMKAKKFSSVAAKPLGMLRFATAAINSEH
jgi:hypothetical protein